MHNFSLATPLQFKVYFINHLLWAWVRNQGKPTTTDDSLDGDVILAIQAIRQLQNFDEVTVVTTNLKHISRFESEGIFVADWQQTLNKLV